MKRTVKRLLILLIGALIVGTTACDGESPSAAPPTNTWGSIEFAVSTAPATSSEASDPTAATESSAAATVTTAASATTAEPAASVTVPVTTAAPVTTSAPVTTTAKPVTETAPVTTTAKPVTTASPVTTAAKPVTVTATATVTTTTKPVTTAAPVTTTAKPVTTAAPATGAPQEACDFVLNTKSKVFHTPGCGSGKNIKAENRGEFNGSWEELVAEGYIPCGNCDPAGDFTPATSPVTTQTPVTASPPQTECGYVLNTKSMKFHEPDCGSAKTIKEENRGVFDGTRDELIAEGYEPCGNCDP